MRKKKIIKNQKEFKHYGKNGDIIIVDDPLDENTPSKERIIELHKAIQNYINESKKRSQIPPQTGDKTTTDT